jgi:hypothetical protein
VLKIALTGGSRISTMLFGNLILVAARNHTPAEIQNPIDPSEIPEGTVKPAGPVAVVLVVQVTPSGEVANLIVLPVLE